MKTRAAVTPALVSVAVAAGIAVEASRGSPLPYHSK